MRLKLIICGRPDGLGARFKNIIFTKSLANFLKVDHLICWPKTRHCMGSLDLLLDENKNNILEVKSKTPKITEDVLIDYVMEKYGIELNQETTYCPNQKSFMLNKELANKYDVWVLYSTAPYHYSDKFKPSMGPTFKTLSLNPFVNDIVSQYKKKYFMDYTVIGIHIRRGDCVDRKGKSGERGRVGIEYLYELLDSGKFEADNYLYFICSDDDTVIKAINDKYHRRLYKNGKKILKSSKTFYYPCRGLDRLDPGAIQDAWIIMNLMTLCKMIICSSSSFNKVPCMIGNVHRCVLRPGNMRKTWREFNKFGSNQKNTKK